MTSHAPYTIAEKDGTKRMPRTFANPAEIASAGQKIYDEKFKLDYESKFPGQYVAIDVNSERAFVAKTATDAVRAAEKTAGHTLIHLIRIGSTGAFKVSYRTNGARDWVFR